MPLLGSIQPPSPLSFPILIAWALVIHGVTQIVTVSRLFAPLRAAAPWPWLSGLLKCPMCTGFWVGFVASTLGLGPIQAIGMWPWPMAAIADGAAASAVAYAVHVVQVALGSESL
jgi:hypothetical protein